MSQQSGNKRQRQRSSKVSIQEKSLHESVFGKGLDVSNYTGTSSKKGALQSQSSLKGKHVTSSSSAKNGASSDEDNDDEDDILDIGLHIDRGGAKATQLGRGGATQGASAAAWSDDDDEDVQVDLKSRDRLRKLQKPDEHGKLSTDSKVSGAQLSSLLQERFQTQKLAWAVVPAEATGDGDIDTPLSLLCSTGGLLKKKGLGDASSMPLAASKLDIQRLMDANSADPSKAPIQAVQFHSGGQLLLATGTDRFLRFFQIDGEHNERMLSVRFNDMPISRASFLGDTNEVVLSGRKPYFHCYDTESGKTSKIPGLMGKNIKSYEHMIVSPAGSRIAFLGASGYVHLVCGKQKLWQCDVKMNTAARAATFSDENTIITSGLDADIYKWDLRMNGRCLSRFKNEDGTCVSSLAVSGAGTGSGSYIAVGSESGALTLYEGDNQTPVKTSLNLTTKIGCVGFHPSSQILSFSSTESNDQLRMLHLSSRTLYSNWPTERTPLRKVQCMAFSPGGAYFAVGNDRGKVLL